MLPPRTVIEFHFAQGILKYFLVRMSKYNACVLDGKKFLAVYIGCILCPEFFWFICTTGSCADPESFARGDPALTTLFCEERGSIYH